MNNKDAEEILSASGNEIDFDTDSENTVLLDGEFTIEELRAILQLMEYEA
jgi:hypothetical protein